MISKISGKKIPSHLLHLKDPSTGDLITNKEDIVKDDISDDSIILIFSSARGLYERVEQV